MTIKLTKNTHTDQLLKKAKMKKMMLNLVMISKAWHMRSALFAMLMFLPGIVRAQTDTIQTNVPALKNIYAKDFTIGCLLSYRNVGFPDDPPVAGQSAVITPNGGYLIKFHMNSMSPGNNMKPQYTVDIAGSAAAYAAAAGAKDSVNTHPVVKFNGDMIAQLNWAKRQGFTFRGHTLVWHNQTPAAFFYTGYSTSNARVTKAVMIDRMDNYIHEVIRLLHESWPGLLSAMDVVNEAINDGTGKVRTTGNDWYTTFGDTTYIMKAFQFTRQHATSYGETQIKLYYNDYNTHLSNKADGIVRLLAPIYQLGYLDGIGMQDHDANTSPTAMAWIDTYNKFDPICTEMAVTELDVSTGSGTNNPSAAILATQANQYGMLFKCFVERSYKSGRGKIISVSKDGLNDQYTFVTNQSSSLWNTLNQCKPSFYAAVNVGINYNALDSMIVHADSLKQSDYSPASWAIFAAALTSAKNAGSQNYSPTVSADTALANAKNNLKAAIDALVKAPSSVALSDGSVPRDFALGQNYPNPFNPSTVISYQLPVRSLVTLKVYTILGREVETLVNSSKSAGSHTVRFDGSNLPSGVYIYRMQTEKFSGVKKLILMK